MRPIGTIAAVVVCALAPAAVAAGCAGNPTRSAPDASDDAIADTGRDHAHSTFADEGGPDTNGPGLLSATGLFSDVSKRTLAPGVIAYDVRWPLYADGDGKGRWLWLPPSTKIDTSDMDQWTFPVGTKMWKDFVVAGQRVETRFLQKRGDGDWFMTAYLWLQDGSDAYAVLDGVKNASGTTHDVPSQKNCYSCHNQVRDVGIGVAALQLSSASGPSTLAMFASMGLLSNPPGKEFDAPGAGAVKDALTYLHANCGHCHSDEGRLDKQTPMRLRLHVSDATPEATGAYTTTFGVATRHTLLGTDTIVVKGKPESSQLYVRMGVRDNGQDQMPPLGTKVVDAPSWATVGQWIAGLQ